MSQVNWVAIIGAIFAGIISVLQIASHSRIGSLEDGTMHKDTIETHVDDIRIEQAEQNVRLDALEAR